MVILVLVVAAIVLGVGIAFLVSYSTKEISDTLGMPAVTVRSHLHRARRHFPAAMNPDRQKEDWSEAGLLHQLGGLEPVEEGLGILGFQIVEPGGE